MTDPPRTALHQQQRRLVLTVEEAAQALHIGRTTMYALIATGQVASVTVGRLRRIPVGALEAYVRGLRSALPPETVGGAGEDPSCGTETSKAPSPRASCGSDALKGPRA
ncbi:MAG: helix-turn-helix domain-containing protein [Sporichthyaceae bacterium]